MFDGFPADLRPELAALADRFGRPLVRVVDLEGGLFDPIHRADGRVGEVCMVVRRRDGTLVTGTKSIYPKGAFRLLTGGIHPGESVLDALVRETREETSLDTEIRRFLAAIAYRRERALAFATFAFLLEDVGGILANADPGEKHEAFGIVTPAGLEAMADLLASMPDERDERIKGSWRDWGRFRAVVHRAVSDALAG